MTNKELIDHHVQNASEVANAQASQLKDLAGHHTARAQETVKSYAGDYSAKASEYIGSARGRSTSPEVNSSKPTSNAPIKSEPGSGLSASDFPHAPKQVKPSIPLKGVLILGFSISKRELLTLNCHRSLPLASLPTKSNTRTLNLVDWLNQPTRLCIFGGMQPVLSACKDVMQPSGWRLEVENKTTRLVQIAVAGMAH